MQLSWKLIGYFLIGLVTLIVVINYGFNPLQDATPIEMRLTYLAHPLAIYIHIVAATFALMIGPFQFSDNLRARFPAFHQILGRLYLGMGVLIGGLSALYMAQFAYGGQIAQAGFATLAVFWLVSGLMGYRAIRQRNFSEHRQWMVRNFSLTFAAVTLRLYIPLSEAIGIAFVDAYPIISWVSWVPNLIYVEWRYNIGGVDA